MEQGAAGIVEGTCGQVDLLFAAAGPPEGSEDGYWAMGKAMLMSAEIGSVFAFVFSQQGKITHRLTNRIRCRGRAGGRR